MLHEKNVHIMITMIFNNRNSGPLTSNSKTKKNQFGFQELSRAWKNFWRTFKNLYTQDIMQPSLDLWNPNPWSLEQTSYTSVNIVSGKNIPNIIDCCLTNRYPILIILCTFILNTTSHQMTVQNSTSPSVCFCTTWGKQNQQNVSWN